MRNRYRLADDAFERIDEKDRKLPNRIYYIAFEGNKTEPEYFQGLKDYKNQLGIKASVKIVPLNRRNDDTNSAPKHVLELLEECVRLRENGLEEMEKEIQELLETIKDIDKDQIKTYIYSPEKLNIEEKKKMDLLFVEFAYDFEYRKFIADICHDGNEYGDVFVVVIDRDAHCRSKEQLMNCYNHCKDNNYTCILSNPCFEIWLLMHFIDVADLDDNEKQRIKENAKVSNAHSYVSKMLSEYAGHSKSGIQFEKNYLSRVDDAIKNARKIATSNKLLSANGLLDEIGSDMWALLEQLKNVD